MSIATHCPNCNAKFRLADELEGKTVKCKRCQNAFVVAAESAVASRPTAQAPRDEDEEEERRQPPSRKRRRDDEDDDDRDDDEDDRPRSRKRSVKRKKKKKSSSMMMIGLIAGGVCVLLFLVCGVSGLFLFLKFRDPNGPLAGAADVPVVFDADGTFQHRNQLSRLDRIKENRRFRTYTARFEAGKTYQIDMTSEQLDSVLFILDDTGKVVVWDDDGGGFPNARIHFRPLRTGNYTIEATSFMERETGSFLLTIRRF